MTAGGVARDAAALYRDSFGRYVAIAAAAFALLQLLSVAAGRAGGGDEPAAELALGLLVLVGSFVAYAALVHGGRSATAGPAVAEAYGATGRRLGPVLAASVVSTLGITVGFVLFVVPGVLLATRWSLVFQALMLEGRGWRAAFGRSAELVRGHFGPMLGLVLVTFAASAVAAALPWAAQRWLPLPDALSGWVVGAAADTLAFPYFALLFNVAYGQLTARPAQA